MPESTQYRIVEVDDPVYGSRYVIQYVRRTFFRNRLVWKDLFINRDGDAGDAIFFSFLMAREALEKHLAEERYERTPNKENNSDIGPEHEGFTNGEDIDF